MKKGPSNDPSVHRPLRIGLFGGTFNPVHIGHLRCMVEIRESFFIDQLVIIPSASPPHKAMEGMVNASERLSMLKLSVSGMPLFTVSDVEIERKGPSYSIDTVKYFKGIVHASDELFFIMGIDAFLELDTWKSHEELLALIPIIIMNRPGKWTAKDISSSEAVEKYLKTHISPMYNVSDGQARFVHPLKQDVFLQNVTPLDISSTRIRQLVESGKSIRYLVPDCVADVIEQKGLYK
ncbi:MAG: nicotinate-nucleotide adenylyltransferase [Proteobacteria bacterium]|nr:nicotinate-nucleotide adenylyltransferase [Pseudomonadota bacterium]